MVSKDCPSIEDGGQHGGHLCEPEQAIVKVRQDRIASGVWFNSYRWFANRSSPRLSSVSDAESSCSSSHNLERNLRKCSGRPVHLSTPRGYQLVRNQSHKYNKWATIDARHKGQPEVHLPRLPSPIQQHID